MFLRCRPARITDFDECLNKARDYHCHTEETRRFLHQMWQGLLHDHISNLALIEDMDAPCGERILWFSFKVFVTDAFVEFMQNGMSLPLNRQLLELWRQGCSPILASREYHRAREGKGVNCVVLNYGMPRDAWTGEKQAWIASRSIEWNCHSLGGYPLRSFHLETYGTFEWDWAQGFGLRPKNAYCGFSATVGCQIAPNDFPRLFGTGKCEMAAYPGTPLSIIFHYQLPRFNFSPSEQELLLWAFSGETDMELSADLHLAPVTLKKRWQSIYECVEAASPGMLGGESHKSGKRGSEKKRRLLNYLRHHLEELRPLMPP